jgi:hypothetical protein
LGVLSRFLGVIAGVFIPYEAGRGSYKESYYPLKPQPKFTTEKPSGSPLLVDNPSEKPSPELLPDLFPSQPKQLDDKNNLLIYRSMKENSVGQPMVEESARGLGVRPGVDIDINMGMVVPFTGGMSASPLTPMNLPSHRRPASMGGTGKDPVFQMNTKDLPSGLVFVPDKFNNNGAAIHGTIQPKGPVSYQVYKRLLESTQPKWSLYGR